MVSNPSVLDRVGVGASLRVDRESRIPCSEGYPRRWAGPPHVRRERACALFDMRAVRLRAAVDAASL